MAATADSLALLRSIDASLKTLVALSTKRQARVTADGSPTIASDRDLDGRYGDPVLKFKPRDWTGADFKNARYSQCPPELLDLVADSLDYFARKADESGEVTPRGKPVSEFKRADAARARGWAKRMRDGFTPRPAAATEQPTEDEPTDWGTPEGTPEGWE